MSPLSTAQQVAMETFSNIQEGFSTPSEQTERDKEFKLIFSAIYALTLLSTAFLLVSDLRHSRSVLSTRFVKQIGSTAYGIARISLVIYVTLGVAFNTLKAYATVISRLRDPVDPFSSATNAHATIREAACIVANRQNSRTPKHLSREIVLLLLKHAKEEMLDCGAGNNGYGLVIGNGLSVADSRTKEMHQKGFPNTSSIRFLRNKFSLLATEGVPTYPYKAFKCLQTLTPEQKKSLEKSLRSDNARPNDPAAQEVFDLIDALAKVVNKKYLPNFQLIRRSGKIVTEGGISSLAELLHKDFFPEASRNSEFTQKMFEFDTGFFSSADPYQVFKEQVMKASFFRLITGSRVVAHPSNRRMRRLSYPSGNLSFDFAHKKAVVEYVETKEEKAPVRYYPPNDLSSPSWSKQDRGSVSDEALDACELITSLKEVSKIYLKTIVYSTTEAVREANSQRGEAKSEEFDWQAAFWDSQQRIERSAYEGIRENLRQEFEQRRPLLRRGWRRLAGWMSSSPSLPKEENQVVEDEVKKVEKIASFLTKLTHVHLPRYMTSTVTQGLVEGLPNGEECSFVKNEQEIEALLNQQPNPGREEPSQQQYLFGVLKLRSLSVLSRGNKRILLEPTYSFSTQGCLEQFYKVMSIPDFGYAVDSRGNPRRGLTALNCMFASVKAGLFGNLTLSHQHALHHRELRTNQDRLNMQQHAADIWSLRETAANFIEKNPEKLAAAMQLDASGAIALSQVAAADLRGGKYGEDHALWALSEVYRTPILLYAEGGPRPKLHEKAGILVPKSVFGWQYNREPIVLYFNSTNHYKLCVRKPEAWMSS